MAKYGFHGFVIVYAAAALLWLPLRNRVLPLWVVLVIALVLRGFLLFPEPRLSGDVYRYLSDGRVVASLQNPYAYTPTDPRINHPEIRSIYPPHAQLLFGAVHDLFGWRLLVIAVDVVAIILLRRHGLAYATFPPVLFEGTWSGHIDAIAGVLVLVALLRKSGVAAGIASGLKVIPLAAVPALLQSAPSRKKFLLALGLALALPVLPFLGGPIMPGFRDYATRWIFNSPLYDAVFAVVDLIPVKEIWTHHPLRFAWNSDFVYRHLYTDFLTRVVMALLAALGIVLSLCHPERSRGMTGEARTASVSTAIAILLLCSPALHPWYWLTLAGAALVERREWLAFALAAPLSYLLYDGVPPLAVYALCYGLPLLGVTLSRR